MFKFIKKQKEEKVINLSFNDLKLAIKDGVESILDERLNQELLKQLSVKRLRDKLIAELTGCKIQQSGNKAYEYKNTYFYKLDESFFLFNTIEKSLITKIKAISNLEKESFDKLYLPILKLAKLYLGNLTDSNSSRQTLFTQALELQIYMLLCAEANTYLFIDHKPKLVKLLILITPILYLIGLSSSKLRLRAFEFTECYEPFLEDLQSYCQKHGITELLVNFDKRIALVIPCFHLGLAIFAKHLNCLFSKLNQQDNLFLEDFFNFKESFIINKLINKALALHKGVEEFNSNECLEAIRPIFKELKDTPKNWYEDNELCKKEHYFDMQRVSASNFLNFHEQYALNSDKAITLYKKACEDNLDLLAKIAALKEQYKAQGISQKKDEFSTQYQNAKALVKANNEKLSKSIQALRLDTNTRELLNKQKRLEALEKLNEEEILQLNNSKIAPKNSNDPLQQTSAISKRYLFSNCLTSILSENPSDNRLSLEVKQRLKELKHQANDIFFNQELNKRNNKLKHSLEIVDSFVKDGSFITEFSLKEALKNNNCYFEYMEIALCLLHSFKKNLSKNQVGIEYLEKMLKTELNFYSSIKKV